MAWIGGSFENRVGTFCFATENRLLLTQRVRPEGRRQQVLLKKLKRIGAQPAIFIVPPGHQANHLKRGDHEQILASHPPSEKDLNDPPPPGAGTSLSHHK